MRIIDRHITKSILSIFIITVFIFSFLYVVIDVTSTLDEIIDRRIPFDILVKYYLSYLPIILVQTASIACLISTLFTFSRLNNDNEVLAMRSSGMNFWQIIKPALYFALLISVIVFWLNERYVPMASQSTKQIRNEHMILEVDRLKKNKAKISNLTFYGLKNRLYYVDAYDPNTNELEGITIIEHDENQNVRQKVVALKGKWIGLAWKFFQCQVTEFDSVSLNNPTKVKVYDEKLMDIKETPEDFMQQRIDVGSMNLRELSDYISRFSRSGATKALNNLRVDLQQKIAYPIGNFVIVLVGLPFAMIVKNRKGMTFTSLGIAVLIGFLYYVVNALALAFGKGGLFPPVFAAWAAPFVFTSIALILIESNFS